MKDVIIKKETITSEIRLWIILFVISFILNAVAIVIYNAPWLELITQLHYVIILSLFLYCLLLVLRFGFYLIKKMISGKNTL